ncbi:MAG TPA: hypothetical protein VHS53_04480, partial [Mucilaginibacter sp.]|nr:hypothetical protein [Mucilaginibacter sp.]
ATPFLIVQNYHKMKTLVALLAVLCMVGLSCKKESQSKKTETMTISVTGARQDYSYNIKCTDITNWTNPQTPEPTSFWTSSIQYTNQTFTTVAYSGERIELSATFNGNFSNLPGDGTVATVQINGTTVLATPHQESSGSQIFTAP